MKQLLISLLLSFTVAVSAAPVNRVVVFGDSLSDNGNLYEFMNHQLPLSPPYFEGRFTNGPVWIEHVINHYYPDNPKDHMLNYAFGGSGVGGDDDDDDSVFTLGSEVDSYLLTHQDIADAQSLFVVWMGANNYIASPDNPDQTIIDVNNGIVKQAERLVQHGAKYILLATLPDLGHTPWAIDFELTNEWTDASLRHNALLRENYSKLKNKHPDVEWILLDVDRMFNQAVESPEQYGFTNISGTCYEAAMPTQSTVRMMQARAPQVPLFKMIAAVKPLVNAHVCDGYLFFDPIHPSARAHQLIGDETVKLFDSLGFQLQ
jgi:phospholipase/lecithinase/hemolysin